MPPRLRLALVVQRCAEDIYGGAELHCLRLAQGLASGCDVTILTTCARDHYSWANEFAEGPTQIGGVNARRFAVTATRDLPAFNRLSERLLPHARTASYGEQAQWRSLQGPQVPALRSYIEQEADRFDAFYFFSYLYATTSGVFEPVAHKAALFALAHDERPLDFSFWDDMFARFCRVVPNSDEERALLERRFPHLDNLFPPVGMAVAPRAGSAPRFRERFGITAPFALYLGRIDQAKGVDTLIADFIALRAVERKPRVLVLAGTPVMSVPKHPDIACIGPVDERAKWDALAAAELVVIPSPLESLSLVALEALAMGKPILVNGASRVLIGHCRRSNAGLWYANRQEFIELLRSDLFGSAAALGARGRAYVEREYGWNVIRERHRSLLAALAPEPARTEPLV